MESLFGAAVLGASLLAFFSLVLWIRRPDAPRWSRSGALHDGIAIGSLGLWSFGAGLLLDGLLTSPATSAIEFAGLTVIALTASLGLYALHPLRRLRAFDARTSAKKDVVTPFPELSGGATPGIDRKVA